jgi:hypothetical protein
MALFVAIAVLVAGGYAALVWMMAPDERAIDATMSKRGPPPAVRTTK